MNDVHFPYGKISVAFLLSLVLLAALVFLVSVLNMQVGEVEVGKIQAAYGTGGGNPTPMPTPEAVYQFPGAVEKCNTPAAEIDRYFPRHPILRPDQGSRKPPE